ncbi:MAG: glycosyltransferase family 39 protein [Chloroflexi bacterium]|nr:glycosyltransferase family 39 protein [Chloroflexota bacterium]MCL5076434.1 glycosyltransferase family 39 protein [Chloroflexota bacterium]
MELSQLSDRYKSEVGEEKGRVKHRIDLNWFSLLLLTLPVAYPLLAPGFIGTHAYGDSPFLILRLLELDRGIRDGVWYPRWAPDFAYGYGYPFLNFYAPLAYYIAEFLHLFGFGFLLSLKLTALLSLVASGIFMYLFARGLWGRRAALLAAIAYIYVPFHLVNVYARGDALGEFTAYTLFPAVLWSFHQVVTTMRYRYIVLSGVLYGALILTHNISAFVFTPLLLAFVAFDLLALVRGEALGHTQAFPPYLRVGASLLAILLGLGLSAFFWWPALGERSYVQLEGMTTGYFDYRNHFLPISRLFALDLAYDYNLDALGSKGLPFHLGLAQAVGVGIALLLLLAVTLAHALNPRPSHPASGGCEAEERKVERDYAQGLLALWFFAVALVVIIFLMLPSSALVWRSVPLMPLIQFPWRLLGLAGLGTSIIIGSLPFLLRRKTKLVVLCPWLIGAALIASVTLNLRPERLELAESDIGPPRIFEYEYLSSSIGTTARQEYLPVWVRERPWTSSVMLTYPWRSKIDLVRTSKGARVQVLTDKSSYKRLRLVADKDSEVVLNLFFFPGWQARLDGQSVPIAPQEATGLIVVNVPAGEHFLEIRFGDTPLRSMARGISIVSLFVLALLTIGGVRQLKEETVVAHTLEQKTTIGEVIVVAIVVGIVMVVMARWIDPWNPGGTGREVLGLQTVAADIHAPLAHRHTAGIRMGDRLTFLGYDIDSLTTAPGERLSLVAYYRAQQDVYGEYQMAARLVAAAEYIRAQERTLWRHVARLSLNLSKGEVFESSHSLMVPPGTAPGLYWLELRVSAEGQPLPVLSTTGSPTDRNILIGPIIVKKGKAPVSLDEASLQPVQAVFGHLVRLLGYQSQVSATSQQDGIPITLYWQALSSMKADYRVSLRLLDAQGHNWGQSDDQPCDGFYPTSLWNTGEVVRDQHNLRPLVGTPPGEYTLEVRLYPLATLRSLEVFDATGKSLGTAIRLGAVRLAEVQGEGERDLGVQHWLEVKLGDQLELIGYNLESWSGRVGDSVHLTLFWRKLPGLSRDYDLVLEILDQGGKALVQHRTYLANAGFHPILWPEGWIVRGQYDLPVGAEVPAGTYSLGLNLVDVKGKWRLLPQDVVLRSLTVESRARHFTIPPISHPQVANLGNQVRFLGFDLDKISARAGENLHLTLYWQAIGPMDKSYSVFVHLLDGQNHIWGQKDNLPGDGALPTSGWAAGEVVIDKYELPIKAEAPPGEYRIEIGMYESASMQRLPILDEEGKVKADHLILGVVKVEQ